MCGILAVNMKKFDKNVVKIIENLNIRGTHAYGISRLINNSIITFKTHQLSTMLKYISEQEPVEFIFHNRYSTSGDYKDDRNNQPIVVGDTAMAFNGVISMKNREAFMQDFNVYTESENDGEIILRCSDQPEQFLKKHSDVSFAGVFLNKYNCYGLRNNKRPMYYYGDNNFKILVSTLDILKRSQFDISKTQIVKPFELVSIR